MEKLRALLAEWGDLIDLIEESKVYNSYSNKEKSLLKKKFFFREYSKSMKKYFSKKYLTDKTRICYKENMSSLPIGFESIEASIAGPA